MQTKERERRFRFVLYVSSKIISLRSCRCASMINAHIAQPKQKKIDTILQVNGDQRTLARVSRKGRAIKIAH